ncbi:hypothetical protein [Geminicoccus flavidas]|uniref:hypothetical protein n=1 Tax=Geminicoccus flavidas TaxID=2506407 RepID=UPI00135B3369|nr:hypothetical protein [Geminicoccus flavidas]
MLARRPEAQVEPETAALSGSGLYSPWDARVERLERRVSFWALRPPIQRRRIGLLGRIEHMTPAGNA